MSVTKALCAGALVLLITSPILAANDPALEAEVDAYLQPLLDLDLISGSILIARGDEILLAKGYGLANREHGIPNTPETKFRIGSMTKQFTAMGILVLADQGKLNLDDPLSKYLPDFPNAEKIQLHQLLSHTSGVPSYNGVEGYGENYIKPWSIDEVIDWFKDEPLQFEPGEDWSYSNSGYVLAAKVIEVVSGQDYDDFLRQEIFEKLEMEDTGQDVFTTVLPHRATGYGNAEREIYNAPYRDMPFTSGAGSLYSTVLDLYKWDRALYTDTLVSTELLDRMMTPVKKDYAYGWFIRDELGHKLVEHGGAINGFLSQSQRFVDDDLVVISLFNYESTFWRPVNKGLAAMALGEEYEPTLLTTSVDVESDLLATYAGTYEVMEDYFVTLAVKDGHLVVTATDDPKPSLGLAQSETKFFFPDINLMMNIDVDEEGQVTGLRMLQGAHRASGSPVQDTDGESTP
jgi:CubicO group peptidase (beta-lactamase class C family)